ncbi:organophosphate reductase [Neisseria cinerea]|uniref:NADP-dependent oxidoreductase domain-containing protein n=1 Tax=Neisseria cinerea ATCC 14685 TaxID=546262 RepID=D0W4Q1_NEICI|nr:organophosphate reductase [Neisseria cinerea]EEZ71196.1 hypothetical protein NEICINOT_04649 [Neisseria cinerea ATCC 14685]MCD2071311.1 hypothetical protein [Neisseria cinerea]
MPTILSVANWYEIWQIRGARITRWLVERDIIVLAKSTKPERMAENLNVFDFALSDEDKAEIAKLDGAFAAIVNHDTVDNLKRISAWKMSV